MDNDRLIKLLLRTIWECTESESDDIKLVMLSVGATPEEVEAMLNMASAEWHNWFNGVGI